MFAAGVNRPASFYVNPRALYDHVFGQVATGGSGAEAEAQRAARTRRNRLVLDVIRGDVKRLEGALAGTERQKLGQYLTSIEDFEKQQANLGVVSCNPGAAPGQSSMTEDLLESMHSIGTLALVCGMTQVVGVSISGGTTPHADWRPYGRIHKGHPLFKDLGELDFYGHQYSGNPSIEAWKLIHNYHGSLIASTIEKLKAVKEGDGTMWDNTVIVYLSQNGEQHHAVRQRWPLLVFGNAGGALKADGRFLRYPKKTRGLGDFYSSLATAVGAPTNDFGKDGPEPVQGPLPEIMA